MSSGQTLAVRRPRLRLVAAALCVMLLATGPVSSLPDVVAKAYAAGAQGTDDAMGPWPMPGGGPSHCGLMLALGPQDAGLAWTKFVSASIRSCPVIDDEGRIYIADNARVTCLAPTGEQLWTRDLGFCAFGGMALGRAADGTLQVYLGLRDPPSFVVLSATNGVKRWHKTFGSPVDGPPAVGPDGTIYFGCDDGRLRALSPSGATVFEHAMGSPVRACPAIGEDGTIYAVSQGGYLHALTPAGALVWARYLGATCNSSPALGPDGRIHVGNQLGDAWCFTPDGDTVYRSKIGGPLGTPAVDGAGCSRFGSTDRHMYALDQSGGVLWSVQTQGQIRAHMWPVVDQGGHTYFGSADGYLRAVDSHGEIVWQLSLGGEPGGLASGADGSLITGTLSGYVFRTLAGLVPPADPPATPPDTCPGLSWPPAITWPAPPQGAHGWYVTYPVLQVDPFPDAPWPSGVVLRWSAEGLGTDGGSITSSPAVITIHVQGQVVVSYWLEGEGLPEGAGTPVTHVLPVDTDPPDIRLAWPVGQWIASGSTLEEALYVGDDASGLHSMQVSLDGEPWDVAAEIQPGSHVLEIRATDRAGHVAALSRQFQAGLVCSAVALNPVVVLSGASYQRSIWGRYVTVMLRVPAAVAAEGHPQDVVLGGVPGTVVARLPSSSRSGMRLYLARFERTEVDAVLAEAVASGGVNRGRLSQAAIDVSWLCGVTACYSTLVLLFRP